MIEFLKHIIVPLIIIGAAAIYTFKKQKKVETKDVDFDIEKFNIILKNTRNYYALIDLKKELKNLRKKMEPVEYDFLLRKVDQKIINARPINTQNLRVSNRR